MGSGHQADGGKYARIKKEFFVEDRVQSKKGMMVPFRVGFSTSNYPSLPKRKGEALSSPYTLHYTSLKKLVNKKMKIM